MVKYVQMNDKTYDLHEGNLNTKHPNENGVWSAEALLNDIESEICSHNEIKITSNFEGRHLHKSNQLQGVYYHNTLIMTSEEFDTGDKFEQVNLDYWACVEMHAEALREKGHDMPKNFLSSDMDTVKEEKFIDDMWAGKIPYLEVRPLLKPCPFCGGEPFEHHHFEQRTCNSYVSIECRSCGATVKKSHGPGEDCRKSATIRVHNIWNKRC